MAEEKESKGSPREYHLSKKQVKFMMARATTPEQHKIFASLMPKPQRKY